METLRLHRRNRLSIELLGALGFAVICVVALSWPSTWKHDTASASVTLPAAPETVIARPYRHLEQSLNASIGYNRTLFLFRIENRDAFAWTRCKIGLNSRWLSGYELKVETINPGLTGAALLHSSDFVDAGGKKFDPSIEKVTTFDLNCESPVGPLSYGGTFGTHEVASR